MYRSKKADCSQASFPIAASSSSTPKTTCRSQTSRRGQNSSPRCDSFLAAAGGRAVPRAANACRSATLTPRERAVLEGIAEGLDNAEIAGSLRLSEKTVRNHITRVFDKICVEHRYQAIVLAREAGLGRAGRLVNEALIRDICPGFRRSPNCHAGTPASIQLPSPALEFAGRASHTLARMPREARRRGREPRGKRNTIRSAQADPLRRWLPNERRTSCMPIFAAHSWPPL